ncbi:HpcH/HpaI aldolase family protein [Alteribacillus bidgolensis]|uniref:4-hydroxy-2-oxoheptanedioate aldolase n=1 Tax=Alteribacillus bidgolensis TaxID=930129 RepID=A0A1G8H3R0_9BACI|nr:aldolase/citrate lyase family protein [Alteribacillus bidgolensis]SDI01199.1 4-hydroxy-2-oxoheptanedioate aldolase [Alteribacillus bidgolensis]
MQKNKVKEKLKKGELTVGVITSLYSSALIEMLGYAGYDFIVIDDEHGAYSWSEIEELIRTSLLVDLVPIVRTNYDQSSIQKALDRGAFGIQVPMVNTKQDAEIVVERAKYPPKGKRGTAFSMRAGGYGYKSGKEFMDIADENTFISVQIETPEGVENFEEIINVPGIDMVFIGPTDLSVNMGYKNGSNNPEVQKTISELYKKSKKAGMPVGTIASSKGSIKEQINNGASFVSVVLTTVIKNALDEVNQEHLL